MRISLVASLLLLTATVPAAAQLSISINIGSYPNFMAVPGYPVYYAPDVSGNYFFYDGLYWVYQDDNWYSSSWYNGPWESVGPMYVPVYVLQIPVRYYRRPPQYFSGWQPDRPPRWTDHWGHDWAQHRQDWDRPRQGAHPAPAPLPDYQRRYSGKDYPRAEQQHALQQQNYHYRPQNVGASRDSGNRPDEHRSGPVQRSNQQQPTRESSRDNQSQSRPVPQQRQPEQRQPEQRQQRRQQQPAYHAPQQDQHPPAPPKSEQPRAPVVHEPGNTGRKPDKEQKQDKDQRQDKDQNRKHD